MMGGRGGMMRGMLDQDVRLSNVKKQALLRVWTLIRPYRRTLFGAMSLMAVVSLSGLAGPYLLKLAIDDFLARGDLNGLGMISVVYALLYAVNWLANYWQTYLVSFAAQSVILDLRRRLFSHMLKLGLRFYDKNQAGRLMSRVTSDVDALNQLVSTGITHTVNDLLTICGIAWIMFYMNWRLALGAFITVPLLVLLVAQFQTRMTRAFHKVRRRVADVNAQLQESISGMKVIQAFGREEDSMQRFSGTNEGNMRANLEAAALFSAFFPLVEFIGAIGTAAVIWYGGFQAGRGALSVGTLVAFLGYVTRFFWPIREISQIYNMFLQAVVSTDRIFEILDEEPDVQDAADARTLVVSEAHVKLERVTFGYEPNNPVLKDISIEAKPGQTIALVGATGAGKTSIINLVSRFYDPWEGMVSIDSQDIRSVTCESLRQQMGIVLQDTFIFSGTIEQNIRYGNLDADESQVVAAAKATGAHQFITRLSDGYATNVQERGSRLSVGQRQLIALARAFIRDPKIIILDEATSSVDTHTEQLIQRALVALLKQRTAIVIAHRLSTVRNADWIYVIDDGRVVEQGTHEHLLNAEGVYKSLYEKQFAVTSAVEYAGGSGED